ncbi:hypothetical protein [Lichenicoccus roseus]|uniref:Uncharacterized protein n=1 Tax=Lichenicoccus roseus TaxID=2683649 RepID=A0A5R9J345_9PROT|nr:hypothetical protein [Lichenicoccus roseus]TLU71263.1 hypothetical protein FE263_17310 [Lichenicoccus roseus]
MPQSIRPPGDAQAHRSILLDTVSRGIHRGSSSSRVVGLLAAATETENYFAVDRLLTVLTDEERRAVVSATIAYLAWIGSRTGRWQPWARALHLQAWGHEAREAQSRANRRIRALRVNDRPAHPTRGELERCANHLIRHGVRGLELLDRLVLVNLTYPEPVGREVLHQAIRAAIRHHAEVENAPA